MSVVNPNQAQQVWLQTVEKVKDRVIAPTLYRALEMGVGLTIDGDYFVVGFSSADYPMSGHLRSSQHLPVIEKCLSEVIGRKVRLRVVEGTTLQDYENFKKIKATADAVRSTLSERKERERQIEETWDEVAEKITRGYMRLPLRQLAQTKGIFIMEAFKFINQAVNQLEYSNNSDEMHKRALSRVFEKLANVVEVPSAMLAYEFFKLRGEGKLG